MLPALSRCGNACAALTEDAVNDVVIDPRSRSRAASGECAAGQQPSGLVNDGLHL
jgi:hypothetical protein